MQQRSTEFRHFNLTGFAGQTPWFGPYFGDRRTIISSPGDGLPEGITYRVISWVFDDDGRLVAECDHGTRQAFEPVTYDLSEVYAEVALTRGMLAILIVPDNPAVEVPALNQAWTLRLLDADGLSDLLVSEIVRGINFPEATGRKGWFRLLSPELCIQEDWQSLACILNVSANPDYDRAIRLEVFVFNDRGETVETQRVDIPPFGAYWLDSAYLLDDTMTDRLGEHCRGSYVATSTDGQAISYHFLYNATTGDIAADHTRPVMRYLRMPYGVTKFGIDQSRRFKVRALASFLKFRLTLHH